MSAEVGGRTLTLETGRVAKQANGAVWVEYGDSRVLVTACATQKGVEGQDFFPLTVDYQEKMASVGRFPGGYIKREGRPQLRETLISRMIDRPIRPLFPETFKNETQVVATVLSADQMNDTDVMAMIGASAALTISDIPWDGPVVGLRVALINGEYVCNPPQTDLPNAKLEIFVASSAKAIVMVEGMAHEVSEEEMIEALMKGFEWAQPIIQIQNKLRELAGKEKWPVAERVIDAELKAKVESLVADGVKSAYAIADKHDRYAALRVVKEKMKEALAELPEDQLRQAGQVLEDMKYDYVRSMILNEHRRIGDRALDEVRQITIETGLLPRVHGSALFTRGETQALATITLGTEGDLQRLDDLLGDRKKRFLLHYNFPPYSVGEVKRMGSPGRRELGHGNLAERALESMLPLGTPEFPYAVRVVSEILESNGSSSMASVCGGCLALMDAGVPIKKPVAGIAMGLIAEGERVAILSDILGDEDHLGDMDFKVCGTRDGITALQMDLKMSGISRELLTRALAQASAGRQHILDKMLEHLPAPRSEYSPYAPRIVVIQINPDRIRDVIGSGGKTIREIVEQTGCEINVEDDGSVQIASADLAACQKAVEIIKGLTEEPEVGKVYTGKIKRITDFGAFVEIIPGIEGLLHISEVAWKRVERMEDYVKDGEIIQVKLVELEKSGKMRLSMKALQERPESYKESDGGGGGRREGGREGGRDGGRGGYDRGRPPRR